MENSDGACHAAAFIFARGGSKGVPRKNIRQLDGMPLIAHAIRVGLATPGIRTVIVSTDDHEIAEVARTHGAEVPFMRPLDLAGDRSPERLAWRHAIEWYEINRGSLDLFVSLPATCPFRTVADVQDCIDVMKSNSDADMVITVTPASNNPYFNMVCIGESGDVKLASSPPSRITRRQDSPVVYDMTAIAYVAKPEFVKRSEGIFEGKVRAVIVPQERALDIDTPFDFEIAEAIMSYRKTSVDKSN